MGCNTIPVRSNKKPKIEWSNFQDRSMTNEEYQFRKEKKEYDEGCAVITGKIWRGSYKDKYLVCFDFDNSIAIEVFLEETFSLFGCESLQELSQKTIVEEHEDAKGKRTDVYIITSDPTTKRNKPRGNKSMEGKEIPELEVKSNSSTYAVCSPTIHMKGHPYQIIGTREPMVLNKVSDQNP